MLSSCFTTSLLDQSPDISSISPNSYNLNRAYYTQDGLLYLDYNSLDNKYLNKKYFTLAIDINTILEEYNKSNNKGYVKFSGSFARKYKAASASVPVLDTGCNNYYQNSNMVFIDFRDAKVEEISTLNAIPDSNLMVYTDVVNSDCINKPGSHHEYYNEKTINSPNDVFVLQALKDSNRLVALRIPLTNGITKLGLLPVTLLLDLITSPIQFGFYVATHKEEHVPHKKQEQKEVKIQPINPTPVHKPNHP